MHLVVIEPFGDHAKGDRITSGLADILATHAGSVVKVAGEEDADPEPAKAPVKPQAAPEPPTVPAPAPAAEDQ